MSDPLASCWAKLDRATAHVDALRAEVVAVTGEDLESVPLFRQYEPEHGAVVYRVERVPEVRDSWGLVIGDALHNFRSALDHLWWQLAIRHLEREPTEKEAKDIQFPIFTTEPVNGWGAHRFLKHVDRAIADQLEPLQPYNAPNDVTSFGVLAEFSNIDKHRAVHVVARPPAQGQFRIPGPDDFHNCRFVPEKGIIPNDRLSGHALYRNDEVVRVYVIPTGPNADVDLQARVTAHITLQGNVGLFESLDQIRGQVTATLMWFAPYVEGPSMGHA
jgi:hypothetical protein